MRFALPLLAAVCLLGAPRANKLEKRHEDWLKGPVSLLITRTERDTFLHLATAQERDEFIDRFWALRNPDPESPENKFKDEFYRRVAWANAHFGADAGTDGWRTDMGKTWILFGKPQQSRDYGQDPQLYRIQLWFYANPGLGELPPFFYVLFYEPDDISGYRLYHPYVNGPRSLVRSGPSNQQAYNVMREISAELAQASLTLIPGEPADTDTYSGSMDSGTILNAIQGYREMPSYIAMINARAARLERVTSKIHYDVPLSSLLTFVAFDRGQPWLHWQLEINDPLQPKAAAGRVEYRIESKLYSNNQLILERSETPSFPAPELPAADLNKRPFVYEDRIPVVPGGYRLTVTARGMASGRTYEATKEFTVQATSDRAALSDPLVIARHTQDPRIRPFSFSGIKFEPSADGAVSSARGLSVLYQIQMTDPRPAELSVEYAVGGVTRRYRKTFEEKLDPRQADKFGSLVVAKTLNIEDVPAGPGQLAVRIKDPQTGKISARSVRFVVAANQDDTQPIVISRGSPETTQVSAADDYARALCWLAQDRPQQAVPLLEASWNASKNPVVRGLLQHLYEQTGQTSRLDLISKPREGK